MRWVGPQTLKQLPTTLKAGDFAVAVCFLLAVALLSPLLSYRRRFLVAVAFLSPSLSCRRCFLVASLSCRVAFLSPSLFCCHPVGICFCFAYPLILGLAAGEESLKHQGLRRSDEFVVLLGG
jgi:hypothetical protein